MAADEFISAFTITSEAIAAVSVPLANAVNVTLPVRSPPSVMTGDLLIVTPLAMSPPSMSKAEPSISLLPAVSFPSRVKASMLEVNNLLMSTSPLVPENTSEELVASGMKVKRLVESSYPKYPTLAADPV